MSKQRRRRPTSGGQQAQAPRLPRRARGQRPPAPTAASPEAPSLPAPLPAEEAAPIAEATPPAATLPAEAAAPVEAGTPAEEAAAPGEASTPAEEAPRRRAAARRPRQAPAPEAEAPATPPRAPRKPRPSSAGRKPRPSSAAAGRKHPTLAVMAAVARGGVPTASPRRGFQPPAEATEPRPSQAARAEAPPTARSRAPGAPQRAARPLPGTASAAPQRTFDEPELLLPMAGVLAAMAAASAVTAALLLVSGHPLGIWLLVLAGIAGAGGGTGYLLTQRESLQASAVVLLAAQAGLLAWALALLGPLPGLLALACAQVWLALRLAGSRGAAAVTGAVLLLYTGAVLLTLNGALVPALALDGAGTAITNTLLGGVGLLLMLAAVLRLQRQRARILALARSRLAEARMLRAELEEHRAQVDDDATRLHALLREVMRGHAVRVEPMDGPLSLLAQTCALVAQRLHTLHLDREERIRLEGALRTTIRAVERSWMGLSWSWPAPSQTALDDLIALLRTPRPMDRPPLPPDEVPTLVPIPGLGPGVAQPPNGQPLGWPGPSAPPHTTGERSPSTTHLHWEEWDPWPSWSPDGPPWEPDRSQS